MNPIERIVRLMTHFNIAATIATAAWVLWTGMQIVAGTSPWPGASATHRSPATMALNRARTVAGSNTLADPAACHGAPAQPRTPGQATAAPHAHGAGWSDT